MALVMPGHDLERDAGGGERLGLLAAPPEHERVAALQPHDRAAAGAPCSTRSALISSWVDLDRARRLAHVDQLGARPARGRAATGRREPVVDDDVGLREQLGAADGEQPRVARPGADQVDGHAAPPTVAEASSSDRGRPARRAGGGPPSAPSVSGSSPSPRPRSTIAAVERREQRLEA